MNIRSLGLLLLLVLSALPARSEALGTAFTYEGTLTFGGMPANGVYDMTFQVFDAATGGNAAGGAFNATGVQVTAGEFSQLDEWAHTATTSRREYVSGRCRFVKPVSDPFGTGDSHNSAMALDDAVEDAVAGDALRFDAGNYIFPGATLKITKRLTWTSRGGTARITAQ